MRPLILRQATLTAPNEDWCDEDINTDPLPATVMISVNGVTTVPRPTRLTEVRVETTDDQ